MKLENTGQETLELGFELAEPGVSICEIDDGIQKRTNENSGKTTLQLPLKIVGVVEGPEDNVDKKITHFIPIETAFGERQLVGILTMVGMVDKLAEKFGDDVSPTDDRFLNILKLKLPGNKIKVTHEIRKDNKGRDQINIVKLEKCKSGSGSGGGASKPATTSGATEDSDW